MKSHFQTLIAFCCFLTISALNLGAKSDDPGEYSFRATPPLNAAQRERLREIVAEDPEAAALLEALRTEAEALIDLESHPLRVIHYEGLVNTDPRRIATVAKLREMADVATLLLYWQATGDERVAQTLRRFILAWSEVYAPTGNDVNENKFYPLFVAYEALRDTFKTGERERVDAWLQAMGELHAEEVRTATSFTNRFTKHIRTTMDFACLTPN